MDGEGMFTSTFKSKSQEDPLGKNLRPALFQLKIWCHCGVSGDGKQVNFVVTACTGHCKCLQSPHPLWFNMKNSCIDICVDDNLLNIRVLINGYGDVCRCNIYRDLSGEPQTAKAVRLSKLWMTQANSVLTSLYLFLIGSLFSQQNFEGKCISIV